MKRGKENTFNNRCRYLCLECWDNGNVSKTRRFPLLSSRQHNDWFGSRVSSSYDACVCTLKEQGSLCLDCKDRQNTEAKADGMTQCHGEGCDRPAGDLKEKRRVCNWCHKRLPRHLSATSHQEWTEKIIAAKQRAALSRQADMEEYNRRRTKLLRMSRRELRGDKEVEGDPDADKQQFVRHLDTFNYRKFMPEKAMPTGNEVYQSQRGHWTYSVAFLEHSGLFCHHLPAMPTVRAATMQGVPRYARTTLAKPDSPGLHYPKIHVMNEKLGTSYHKSRLREWHEVKAHVLELLIVKRVPFQEAQALILEDFHFYAAEEEYEYMFAIWKHDWLRVRFSDEQIDQGEDMNVPPDHDDLAFAKELQRQMDQEAAEAMQADIYDAEENLTWSSSRPQAFQEQRDSSDGEEDDAHATEADQIAERQEIDAALKPRPSAQASGLGVLSASTSSSSEFSVPSGFAIPSSSTALQPQKASNTNPPTMQPQQQASAFPQPPPQNSPPTTSGPLADLPPPYEPPSPSKWRKLRLGLKRRWTGSSSVDESTNKQTQLTPTSSNPGSVSSSDETYSGKGKSKGKEREDEEPFMTFDFEDEGLADGEDDAPSTSYRETGYIVEKDDEGEEDEDEDEVIYKGREGGRMPGEWCR